MPPHRIQHFGRSDESCVLISSNPRVASLFGLTPSKALTVGVVDPVKSVADDFSGLTLSNIPHLLPSFPENQLVSRTPGPFAYPTPARFDLGGVKVAAEYPKGYPRESTRNVGLKSISNGHPLDKQVAKVCVSCDIETSTYAEAPCADGHVFCAKCLATLFTHAIADRSLMPIKCCKVEMDQNLARFVLPEADFEKFQQIGYELSTHNKMYCSNNQCTVFLDLDRFELLGLVGADKQFECPGCSTSLCASCKTTSHPGMTCGAYMALPEDQRNTADAAFFEMARREGLARCNQCRSVVELEQGCNHMTCRCSYEFCYPCGAKWKTCKCVLWEENRLEIAAVARAGPGANADAVQRAVRHIRREEDCVEHRFVQKDGIRPIKCRNCGFGMYSYKFQCAHCHFDVCYTCRYHRL